MSLSDLASLGSFVSGLAVVITLIFLLLQMRQTDKNQRASMQLGRAMRANDTLIRMTDTDFARVITKARRCDEALNEVELSIWMSYVVGQVVNWEDSFLQNRAGVLDTASIQSDEGNIRFQFTSPAFQAAWQICGRGFPDEFRRYIDSIIGQVKVLQPTPLVSRYEAILRDQLAHAEPAS